MVEAGQRYSVNCNLYKMTFACKVACFYMNVYFNVASGLLTC